MGRQIACYMLPDDRDAFLRFARKDDIVEVIAQGNDSPIVRPLDENEVRNQDYVYLWNRRILPRLKRKWIAGPRYYGVSVLDSPVLEFSNSALTQWQDKPALIQGRLYGVFDPYLEKPPEFSKWFERLVRWIRNNLRKCPTSLGGYVGPAAYELYEKGAYLLPQFLPPRTEVWLDEIGKQHDLSQSATTQSPLVQRNKSRGARSKKETWE